MKAPFLALPFVCHEPVPARRRGAPAAPAAGFPRLGLAVLAAVLAAALPGCSRGPAGSKQGPPPVLVLAAQAAEQDVPVQLRAIGNVLPYSKVTIRSQVTGQLQAAHFKEGQEVHQGDPLFTIDPRPAQAALEQARANLARDEAQLENARVVFERTRQLLEAKFVSQEVFDNARAAMAALQGTVLADRAAITNADLELEFTAIRSPVDGVAGSQLVYPGNIIKSPDDAMVMINQIHPIYVAFAVPEQYLPEIRREMRAASLKATVTFEGLTGSPPAGDLTFVDNTVDPVTGTIQLKATFANADSVLWPGQFVQVTLTLTEVPRAVVVPAQALQTGQSGDYLFVVKPDQTVEMRPVKAGERYEGVIVVASGLQPGETVVTDGQLNLVPGKKVAIQAAGTNPDSPAGSK
jgi:membrane fusion protein, multidrug efflux system